MVTMDTDRETKKGENRQNKQNISAFRWLAEHMRTHNLTWVTCYPLQS